MTKNRDSKQIIDFWPQISKFSGQNCTFSYLAANWSRTGQCFQHKNGQIWSKIYIYVHFVPNIGIFGPFRPMPDQKTMQTRCLGIFSVMRVTKLLLSPLRIRFFCPKTTKFGQKLAFLVILGQALPAHLVPCW